MPHKLLCISTNNEADLEAAKSFEITLAPHESQKGSFWIGRTDMPRGQLVCFSRDQPLTTFYISDHKNTVYVSLPEEHLLYAVVENLQAKLKAINPDVKDILREPREPSNPKFIVLHTEYTHEGGQGKGACVGWNS